MITCIKCRHNLTSFTDHAPSCPILIQHEALIHVDDLGGRRELARILLQVGALDYHINTLQGGIA